MFVDVIVNVSQADDEQDARVPKTGEQGKKRAYKGKRSTDLSDLSLNPWLDDMAIQQDANRVSCQVTVVVVVTDIDVSSTVDNLGAICDNVVKRRCQINRNLRTPWLWSSQNGRAHELGEALGTELDGCELSSRVMRQGLTAFLRRRRCSGRALERVIGHCTFMGLASRGTLCTFHTGCRFIQSWYPEKGQIWEEVLAELRCFRGLLVVLSSSWWLPWNPLCAPK